MRVLIISAEPRLFGLTQKALGPVAKLSSSTDWEAGRTAFGSVRFDLICVDYECIRSHNLNAVVALRGLNSQPNSHVCLLARTVDSDVECFEAALPGLQVIDMSKGKEHFNHSFASYIKVDHAAVNLESELEASLAKMMSLSKYELFGAPKGCGPLCANNA